VKASNVANISSKIDENIFSLQSRAQTSQRFMQTLPIKLFSILPGSAITTGNRSKTAIYSNSNTSSP
jgi:hypothetical protein